MSDSALESRTGRLAAIGQEGTFDMDAWIADNLVS